MSYNFVHEFVLEHAPRMLIMSTYLARYTAAQVVRKRS